MDLGLDGFLAGLGGVLAQDEGGVGPGWVYSWVGWVLAQGEGGFGPG